MFRGLEVADYRKEREVVIKSWDKVIFEEIELTDIGFMVKPEIERHVRNLHVTNRIDTNYACSNKTFEVAFLHLFSSKTMNAINSLEQLRLCVLFAEYGSMDTIRLTSTTATGTQLLPCYRACLNRVPGRMSMFFDKEKKEATISRKADL